MCGDIINWYMFLWCFCFIVSLLIFLVELCGLQSRLPFSWDGFLYAYAFNFTIVCLTTSIIFGTAHIQFLSPGPTRDRATTATAFSCIVAVLYAIEVAWVYVRPGDISCFVPTLPGMLRRLESIVACLILTINSSRSLYQHQPALEWCVAVYAICFILGAVNFLVNGSDCDNDKKLPIPYPRFLQGQTVLSLLLYASALVLWPLYQFSEKLGGQPQRSSDDSCSDHHTSFVFSLLVSSEGPSVPSHVPPPHPSLFSVPFPSSALSPSLFSLAAHTLLCLSLCLLSSFLHFLLFGAFLVFCLLISCELTTFSHVSSPDHWGP
uniref:MARVEL domain-containing protein n=1 Tax=Sus scrofa TaxID=9823 RepID=A0A4X1U742_PIG